MRSTGLTDAPAAGESFLLDNAVACWKHLRLPFQLTLAPIYLWGALLSRKPPGGAMAFGFLISHFFLYSAITAFNSSYDRDSGPIGGMYAPPPVPAALRPLSLALMALGAVLAITLGLPFLVTYLTISALGIIYSWPPVRIKSRPVQSAAAVFVGQGLGGFLLGFLGAGAPVAGILAPTAIAGLFAAGFATIGIYPLTQAYQTAEDRLRGDHTLAVWLGPERAIGLGAVFLTIAGCFAAISVGIRYSLLEGAELAAGFSMLCGALLRSRALYSEAAVDTRRAFRTSTALTWLCSAGLSLFVFIHWLFRSQ